MPTTTQLMTIDEYLAQCDNGQHTELVRGKVVAMNLPKPRHGEICSNIDFLLRLYLRENPIGRVLVNDSGIVTERDPDTLRGGDVVYYSYERLPKGPLDWSYLSEAVPELVFEVISPGGRPRDVTKTGEYLAVGVMCVCLVDDQSRSVSLFRPEESEVKLTADQTLTVPDILPGFSARVEQIFE